MKSKNIMIIMMFICLKKYETIANFNRPDKQFDELNNITPA